MSAAEPVKSNRETGRTVRATSVVESASATSPIPRAVECRTIKGEWLPAIALSPARYDWPNAVNRLRGPCFLTISVDIGTWGHPVNWPVEDVREVSR